MAGGKIAWPAKVAKSCQGVALDCQAVAKTPPKWPRRCRNGRNVALVDLHNAATRRSVKPSFSAGFLHAINVLLLIQIYLSVV